MLTKDQVQHIANLARIELTDEEQAKFSDQLSRVLDYVDLLKKVSSTGIETADGGTIGISNVFRCDCEEENMFKDSLADDLVAFAPETENRLVKVEKIF